MDLLVMDQGELEAELARLRAEDSAGNPFKLPQNETEILQKGEIERRRKQIEKELFKDLRVHQKTTMASRVSTIPQVEVVKQMRQRKREQSTLALLEREGPAAVAAHAAAKEARAAPALEAPPRQPQRRSKDDAAGSGGAFLTGVAGIEEEVPTPKPVPKRKPLPSGQRALPMPKGLEKENVRGFVQKKRQMFLVQMKLDVKRAMILKLDEKARRREEALKKSQAMLDEDITRFDTFLQENDGKAHAAMKYSEECGKKRQEKVAAIKQIRAQVASIQSDTTKLREQGEEAIRYKKFLEDLTPQEWKDQQAQAKQDRKDARKTAWVNLRMDGIVAELQEALNAEEADVQLRLDELRRKMKRAATRQAKDIKEEILAAETALRIKREESVKLYPKRSKIEEEYVGPHEEDSEEEIPLYFVEPQQLVDAFIGLEEQNLFLIQNVQLAEQELDELEARYEVTIQELSGKTNALRGELKSINRQVKTEQTECAKIKETFAKKAGSQEQEKALKDLEGKVVDVYQKAGFDTDHDPHPLQMLGSIEAKLESLLSTIEQFEATDPELVMKAEYKKDKERRERVREERLRLEREKNEDRLKQSLARSQAPVVKKTGKKIMFRSNKPQEKKVVVDTSEGEAMQQDLDRFGVYIGKNAKPSIEPPDLTAGTLVKL